MSKIALLTAPNTIEIRRRERPYPGPQEVVVAVEAAGICGTDLAIFSGDYRVNLPLVLGHEFVGTVVKTGEGVDKKWLGRRVTAEINNTCLAYKHHLLCHACAHGMPNHCQTRTVTGIIGCHGAFAEEVVVPAGTLHEIPDTLDSLTASLTEPLAAALQTFIMTPVTGKETVVVLGAGRLGVLIIFVAALKGLRVMAVSRSTSKRERALGYGAAQSFSPDRAEMEIKDRTGGIGADIVVDATGSPFTQAFSLVRPQGTIAVKTTCGLPAQGFDMTRLVVNEIRLQGSRCGPFEPAIEILDRHQNQLKNLITSIRSLDDAQNALESAFTENKVVFQSDSRF